MTVPGQSAAVTITPVSAPIRGAVTLPGSKSVTNRALLLAALADGRSTLTGALKSDDTRHMANGLRQMGVAIDEPDETSFVVTGTGRLSPSPAPLFLGNAGTATRFLAAAAANVEGISVIDGDAHMRKRPIAPLLRALNQLGIETASNGGCPPATIVGTGGIPGGRAPIDGRLSSQYVSALLMAAAAGKGPVEIVLDGPDIGARGYVELTLRVMAAFGAAAERIGDAAWRVAPTGYRATDFAIEADASAATYIWAAEALTGGSIDLGLPHGGMNQPDAAAHSLIATFPALPPVIDGAQMQDAVPTLAVLASFNRAPVRFTGIANLRVKECDRIAAIETELRRIRPDLARIEGDDLIVSGDPSLAERHIPTRIHTYSDHRIAMAFALAGLRIGGLSILDPGCVAKTFPGYWRALASLGVELRSH